MLPEPYVELNCIEKEMEQGYADYEPIPAETMSRARSVLDHLDVFVLNHLIEVNPTPDGRLQFEVIYKNFYLDVVLEHNPKTATIWYCWDRHLELAPEHGRTQVINPVQIAKLFNEFIHDLDAPVVTEDEDDE